MTLADYVVAEDALPDRCRPVYEQVHAAGLTALVHELPESVHTAAQAAAALGCEVGAIGNSLVFLVDDEPLLVMTSGRHRVDTEILAASLGATVVQMAPAKVVKAVTGQVIGGVAPVGHPTPLRTLVDESLRDYPTIWTAAGTPPTVMPMTFDELVTLTGGQVIAVARD